MRCKLLETINAKLPTNTLFVSLVAILLLFFFQAPAFPNEVMLACEEENKVGFSSSKNMKNVSFKTDKFIMKYNTEEINLVSRKIFLFGNDHPFQKCDRQPLSTIIVCTQTQGGVFSFDPFELSFVRTSINAGWPDEVGDNSISYGMCERF